MAARASFITKPRGLAIREALCKNQGLGGPGRASFGGPESEWAPCESWVLVDGDALIYSRLLCAGEGTERNSHKSFSFSELPRV